MIKFVVRAAFVLVVAVAAVFLFRKLAADRKPPPTTRNEAQILLIEGRGIEDEIRLLENDFGVAATATAGLVGLPLDRQPFAYSLRASYPFLRGLPLGRSLEGYLFPDTYRVWQDELPEGLVRRQLDEFGKLFGDLEVTKKSAPLKTLDEIVILASLVEEEVPLPEDRRIVAGIFLRRLKEGMRLQSDASVRYLTGSNRDRATAEDLAADSPYNLYKYAGLPPGPICNPSESAMRAVLDPEPTRYRYFLTDKNGKVLYASTLDEHARNRWRAGY